MDSKQSMTHALKVANRTSALHRTPGGELSSADIALALARRNAGEVMVTAKLLAELLRGRKAKR